MLPHSKPPSVDVGICWLRSFSSKQAMHGVRYILIPDQTYKTLQAVM